MKEIQKLMEKGVEIPSPQEMREELQTILKGKHDVDVVLQVKGVKLGISLNDVLGFLKGSGSKPPRIKARLRRHNVKSRTVVKVADGVEFGLEIR